LKYINAISNREKYFETERLTPAQKYNEYIMTGLRTKWGIDRDFISKFGDNISEHFEKELKTIDKEDQLIEHSNHLKLSADALLHADRIASELFFVEE